MSATRAAVVLVVASLVYGVQFSVDQWGLLIVVFFLTLAALYGLGMVLASLFLMWGREAWHLTQLLTEPVYFVSGLNFPVAAPRPARSPRPGDDPARGRARRDAPAGLCRHRAPAGTSCRPRSRRAPGR